MVLKRPKIASNVLQRSRIALWLDFHASTPVRYLCAPPGSGKTTAAVLYARSRPNTAVFISVLPATDVDGLLALFQLGLALAHRICYADLVSYFMSSAPLEIIVDNVDDATVEARAMLAQIVHDVPDLVTFTYCARSEIAIPFELVRVQGLIDICDAAAFAFDVDETTRYASSLGLRADPCSIEALLEATHGWAAAVTGVCRFAAGHGLSISDGLPFWHRRNSRLIDELVTAALARVESEIVTTFQALLAGRVASGPDDLETFRIRGLFVTERNGRLVLNPLLDNDGRHAGTKAVDTRPSLAVIEMFGRFEMSIEGRTVNWIRLRDRQIVQYLAMQPNGRATRSEIIATFWPEADRQLARQSLRTACSTIRRAIAACTGHSNVQYYFGGENALELKLDTVSVSANAFVLQFERAEIAYYRDELAAAFLHYRNAESIYRAPFLAGEPPASWAVPHAERLASLHHVAATRLDALSGAMRRPESGLWDSRRAPRPVSA